MNHYIKHSFRAKLILCFVLCAVLPVLLIGIASYAFSIGIAKDKLIESTTLSANQVSRTINERMNQVENMAESVHFNLYMLNSIPQEPLSVYLSEFSTARNNITSLINAFDVYHISIFTEPGTIISNEGVNFLSFDDLEQYHISTEQLINLGVSPKWIYTNKIDLPYVVTNGRPPLGFISCYRTDMTQSGFYNYIFGIHLTSDEISDILKDSYTDSEINAYIINEDGTIIAGRDTAKIGTVAQSNKEGSYTLTNSISKEWSLITEIPDYYIRQNTQILVNILILSLIVILLVTIVAIFFVSAQLTRKINMLSLVMEDIQYNQGIEKIDLPSQLMEKLESGDEIDRLTGSFNRMIRALNSSFNEILDLSIKEERLNYSLLQSQINPHFLYNILGSIRTLLSLGQLKKADQMLLDLSRFYKGMLRKSEDLIPIGEELDIAELYLKMEALCKNNSFTWNIHLDDGVEHFLICKFTLQPILENSIQHGLSNSDTRMHINISIVYSDDMIRITINDDGIGIPPRRLEEIRHDLAEKIVRYDKNFGISNINSRISSSLLEYGSMTITSAPNEGTKVCIMIPQILNE